MTGHRHHRHGAKSGQLLHLGSEHTHLVAGVDVASELLLGESHGLQQHGVEPLGARIEHLACAQDGVFTHGLPCEHIAQGIGDKEQLAGCLQRRVTVLAHCGKLEKRIEVHELYACALIDLLSGNLLKELLHDALGVWVAVGERIAEHVAVLSHTDEIDAPGVDAYTLEPDTLVGHHTQGADDLVIKCIDVPVEMPAQLGDAVWEARQFALYQLALLHTTQYGTAARCPQIHCHKAGTGRCRAVVSIHVLTKNYCCLHLQI